MRLPVVLPWISIVVGMGLTVGGTLVLLAGCAAPLGPAQRGEVLDALELAVRSRLYDPGNIHDSWLTPAQNLVQEPEVSPKTDRRLAVTIDQCMRTLASHSHVHPPGKRGERDLQIPFVTTEDGVSVLHRVRSKDGQTILPGDLLVGFADAREMRRQVEFLADDRISLTVRALCGEQRTLEWERSSSSKSDAVTSRTLPDGTLYVKIDSFTGFGPFDRGNFRVIRRHLLSAADGGALLLDLRGNPGGGRSAMDTATLFFNGTKTFAFFLSRDYARDEQVGATDGVRRVRPELSLLPWITVGRLLTYLRVMKGRESFAIELTGEGTLSKTQVAVLIDEGTRSAAEMLASFLREQCGAILIGRRSGGECAMPVRVDLPHGWYAHMAAMRLASGEGVPIEGRGLEPDILVKHSRADLALGRDADIEHAVAHLAQATPGKRSPNSN